MRDRVLGAVVVVGVFTALSVRCAPNSRETSKPSPPSPSPTVEEKSRSLGPPIDLDKRAPKADDTTFEMHIRFDSQGKELSRECIRQKPVNVHSDSTYKVWEHEKIECPSSVVVTVGTRSDPLGIR